MTLKAAIERETGCPPALQKLVLAGRAEPMRNDEKLRPEASEFVLIMDESPMFTWDCAGNPCHDRLEITGSTAKCPNMNTDFINIVTKEPMRRGVHYFHFIMHSIGDEQWCGVVSDPDQAGPRLSGRELTAWAYYCGRIGSTGSSIMDGFGCLHAEGRAVKQFRKLKPHGDVIGMLVDLERAAIAFELNGELQGACAIPKATPLWVLTHMDEPEDHVELVKLPLQDAPQESIQALSGALLDTSMGFPIPGGTSSRCMTDSSDEDISSEEEDRCTGPLRGRQ